MVRLQEKFEIDHSLQMIDQNMKQPLFQMSFRFPIVIPMPTHVIPCTVLCWGRLKRTLQDTPDTREAPSGGQGHREICMSCRHLVQDKILRTFFVEYWSFVLCFKILDR